MLRRFATLSYLSIGLAVSSAAVAHAQSTMGSFGSRNVGSSFSPAASNFSGSAGARSSYAAGLGGGQGGLGALGQTGVGGSLAGATTRADTSAGQITGNERFLRNNRQPGQFVGSDSADASNFFSQLSGLTGGQLGRGQNRNDSANNLNNVRMTPSKARVQMVPGFTYAGPGGDRVSLALEDRLGRSSRIERLGPITVRIEGRTAVLSGLVATQHDRDLAERVALLEAGVSAVRNELQVAPSPELPPTGLPPSQPAPSSSATPPPSAPATANSRE
jgi:hypothetical protein